MTERRWSVGQATSVSGITFRVVVGRKEPGDLRLEWRTSAGWRPIEMAAAALMVDFFVENEEHLRQYRPHWRQTGADHFFGFLRGAVEHGWEPAYATWVQEQRGTPNLVAAAAEPRWCGERAPDGSEVCTAPTDHDGPHKGPSWVWPKAA